MMESAKYCKLIVRIIRRSPLELESCILSLSVLKHIIVVCCRRNPLCWYIFARFPKKILIAERKRPCQSHPTSGTGIKIQKFDGKNFALWKQMMQDVLITRRQVEAIRHIKKPASMTIEEWKLIDKIVHSTIRMHLAENIYFSMTKETTCWESNSTSHSIRFHTSAWSY